MFSKAAHEGQHLVRRARLAQRSTQHSKGVLPEGVLGPPSQPAAPIRSTYQYLSTFVTMIFAQRRRRSASSHSSTEGSPQVPACTTLYRTHIESLAQRSPTARARPQPVCTMIHVMICCAFVRGTGQCWQELPLTSSSLPTTSTMASGGKPIIIFSPPPLTPRRCAARSPPLPSPLPPSPPPLQFPAEPVWN